MLASIAVWTLLEATRIKWFSDVRDFSPRLFVLYLLFAVPLSLWEPWAALLPLWAALDRLGQAALVACPERRHGLLLWRGHVESRPWERSVSRRPPTRTATGARPA